jgi:hypothetical protein
MKYGYLKASLFFTAWLVLAFFDYKTAYFSKAVLQYFASGVSFYKQFFFLLWAALVLLLLALPTGRLSRLSQAWLWVPVGLTLTLNALSHFLLYNRLGLPFGAMIITVVPGDASSNILLHTHTLKSVLIPVIKTLGLETLYGSADPGLPYFELLPHWLVYSAALMVAFSGIMMLYFLAQGEKDWPAERRLSWVAAGVIASSAVVKGLVDGGAFCPEMIASLPALIVLLNIKDRSPFAAFRAYLKLVGIFLAAGALVGLIFIPDQVYYQLLHSFLFFSCLCLIVIVLGYGWKVPAKRLLPLGLWVSLILLLSTQTPWYYELLGGLRKLSPTDVIYFRNSRSGPYDFPVKYQDGPSLIHTFYAHKSGRILDIYSKLNIPVGYGVLAVAGKTCDPAHNFREQGKLRILDQDRGRHLLEQRSPGPNSAFSGFSVTVCRPEDFCDFQFQAILKGCVPTTAMEPSISYLKELGLREFVIISDNLQ